MKPLTSIAFVLLVTPTVVWAQQPPMGVLRGMVIDRTTRLPIENVNVFFVETTKGTITDHDGRFSLGIPLGGAVHVIFSHIGYEKLSKAYRIDRRDTLFLEISLKPRVIRTGEVTVTAKRPFSERRIKYTVSGVELRQCGEKDMEHKLRYLLPDVVKPYEVRMMRSNMDFTLYLNGHWIESAFLNDIDPATVKRVVVWGGLGNEPPIGFSAIRGGHVVNIETE